MALGPGHLAPDRAPERAPVLDHASIHVQLRRATDDQHRRLDHGLGYVLSDRLTTERYVDLLAALFAFYAPLEQSLSDWEFASPPLGLPLIRRADLLQRDLRAFGREPECIQPCADVPAFTSRDQAAGAIYVVEGACLGGQVIARGLLQRLGIGPDSGVAFFSGDGKHTGARWKQVLAWLDGRGRDPGSRDQTVAGACRTFAALTDWLAIREALDE